MPDRMAKETELLKTIGKKSDCAERSGVIVAGTQVLEQSLDIDFDFLITDLCPMDLLLQRIGRLHRHKRGFRPEGFKQARCMVLNCGDKFENAAEAIYGGWLLTRTQKLLPGEIAIPADIAQLVQGTYAHWSENEPEIKSKWDEYAGLIEEKERRAESFRLAAPQESRRNNTLHGWLTCGVHDGNAEATVRDGISSLEALVMAKGESGAITFLPWQSEGESFSGGSCPDDEACRKIARQRIRLPSLLCKPWSINKTIMDIELADGGLAVWQSSHWLAGELILLLDKDFSAVVNGYRLTYKQETGLTYKKEEK